PTRRSSALRVAILDAAQGGDVLADTGPACARRNAEGPEDRCALRPALRLPPALGAPRHRHVHEQRPTPATEPARNVVAEPGGSAHLVHAGYALCLRTGTETRPRPHLRGRITLGDVEHDGVLPAGMCDEHERGARRLQTGQVEEVVALAVVAVLRVVALDSA